MIIFIILGIVGIIGLIAGIICLLKFKGKKRIVSLVPFGISLLCILLVLFFCAALSQFGKAPRDGHVDLPQGVEQLK